MCGLWGPAAMTDKLVEHARRLLVGRGFSDEIVARNIRANPQAHIQALVEAGVLTGVGVRDMNGHYLTYTVVQSEPRCTAWVEIGHGRQVCIRELGHEGVHTSGEIDVDPQAGGSLSFMWNTGDSE
jgi:hypothetical protein